MKTYKIACEIENPILSHNYLLKVNIYKEKSIYHNVPIGLYIHIGLYSRTPSTFYVSSLGITTRS